jgi:thiol-disulfide isomerase/thioredoxin
VKHLHILKSITFLCLLSATASAGPAEKWTVDGETIEGRLSGVYGTVAHIVGKKKMRLVAIDSMDDASLDQVARNLASRPAKKPWATSDSTVAKAIKGKLQILKDGKLVDFNPGDRPEPEFYAIYFSAHWCGPCRRFTPKLVKAYQSLQALPKVAEKVAVLFNSWDNDRNEQIQYVNEVGMPWPIVKFNANIDIIEKWKGNGIPCMAVINRNGDILFHSYNGGEYQGADQPWSDLLGLLNIVDPDSPEYSMHTHRLAVRQQILAGTGKSLPADIHYAAINRKRYHGLEGTQIKVRCQITEKGRVDSFTVEPELPAAYGTQLREDIGKWLFLPAVENGQARPQECVVPVTF